MSSRPVLVLLLVPLFLFSFGESAFAASTSTSQTTLENATVNIYCRIKTSGRTYSTTGSGVFIHESGIILTNAHVAQYFLASTTTRRTKVDCSVRDGSPAREKYSVELLYLSPNWAKDIVEATTKAQPKKGTGEYDFAFLRVTKAKKGTLPERFPTLPLELGATRPVDGENVEIAGYPAEGLSFASVQRKLVGVTVLSTITSVQSFERPNPDMLILAPSRANAAGISGGPVARSSGELLGIAVTVQENRAKNDRSLRAITLSYIDRMLQAETGMPLQFYLLYAVKQPVNPALSPFSELWQSAEKTLRSMRK